MTKKIQRYLNEARKQSLLSDYTHKVGCVIVSGNVIISKAYNEIRYCKVGGKSYSKWEGSLHSERSACRKVDKDKLIGSTVYIYRETKDGKPALAYPCPSCFKMLNELHIKRIIFSMAESPFYGEIRL